MEEGSGDDEEEHTYVWNSRPLGAPGGSQTLQIELEMDGENQAAAAAIVQEAQSLPARTPPAEVFLLVAKRAEEKGVKLKNAALLQEAVENYAALGHMFSKEQREQLAALRAQAAARQAEVVADKKQRQAARNADGKENTS